jgi:DNA-binding CsgD family transcriptional regulator
MESSTNGLKVHDEILTRMSKSSRAETKNKPIHTTQIDELINGFSRNDFALKVVVDLSQMRILSISDNLEELTGYTTKDYNKDNILIFLKAIHPDHKDALLTLVQWGLSIYEQMPANTKFAEGKTQICGLKVKRKDGTDTRTLLRFSVLELDDNNFPKICFLSFDFIEHLLKPTAHWWGRINYGEANPHKFYILSTDSKNVFQDILSNREKGVLKLVAAGLESKEIAEKLFISINTVDNHRRNAIVRTGARDTTGLIQIGKMCGML